MQRPNPSLRLDKRATRKIWVDRLSSHDYPLLRRFLKSDRKSTSIIIAPFRCSASSSLPLAELGVLKRNRKSRPLKSDWAMTSQKMAFGFQGRSFHPVFCGGLRASREFVGWSVPASVSQGRICSDDCTSFHSEIEASDHTFFLTQSQHADTGPTSSSADPMKPGACQGSHWSTNISLV